MKISRSQACQVLGVSEDASLDEIRSSYKHLARKWHPDKQDGTVGNEQATEKFQEVSAAYKRLTSTERDDEDGMTLAEMMELYRQFFSFGNVVGQCSCRHHHPPYYRYNEDISDYDDYDYTEDEDSDDEFWESITSRLRNKFEARKYMQKDTPENPRSQITEEEALRNAQELIEEEEIEKRRKEKKKAKKKKKKEKRKQKDKEQKTEKGDDRIYVQEEKPMKMAEEEKSATEIPKKIANGHIPQNKSSVKNSSIKNNSRKLDASGADKNQKPIKRVIVQEDIRPCITKESKQNKGNKLKKDSRTFANGKENSDGEEQFDANSAFFARAASKAPSTQVQQQNSASKDTNESKTVKKDPLKKNNITRIKENGKISSNAKEKKEEHSQVTSDVVKKSTKADQENAIHNKSEVNSVIDDVIIKSRELAVEGNNFASKEKYFEAIRKFSEAIDLDPTDFRFFGNRSYCFDRTRQFDNALKDAESAIRLAAHWPKGYFRKGRALTGLKRYQEAEVAFQIVLKLDADCPDAQFELAKVRVRILTDMGFDIAFAEESVKKHGTVQSALEALLAGNVTPRSDGDRRSLSETELDTSTKSNSLHYEKQPIIITTTTKSKPQSTCTALWVGNVCPQNVSDKQLTQLFAKCGKLVSVRLLPEKYCAFINYQQPESASQALEKLQGYEIGGQNLLIRYPNNPPPGSTVHQVVPEKNNSTSQNNKKSVDKSSLPKVTGPVNGNECYFWRTTGCVFESHCRYRHVSDHKGIDLPKVHAKYGNLL